MKRFSLITTSLMLAVITGLACACHKPAETSVSTTTTTTVQTTTTAEVTSSTTALTETVPTTASETSGSSASGSSSAPSYIEPDRGTYIEDRRAAKGKFNYVLKNKDWKFDGEMYYHKYSDGTTVYYDKEVKSWFVMDNKGQGWYYDPEIDDFVRDE